MELLGQPQPRERRPGRRGEGAPAGLAAEPPQPGPRLAPAHQPARAAVQASRSAPHRAGRCAPAPRRARAAGAAAPATPCICPTDIPVDARAEPSERLAVHSSLPLVARQRGQCSHNVPQTTSPTRYADTAEPSARPGARRSPRAPRSPSPSGRSAPSPRCRRGSAGRCPRRRGCATHHASQSVLTLRQARLTTSLLTAPSNRPNSARFTRRVLVPAR